jgi:hypothetical protein
MSGLSVDDPVTLKAALASANIIQGDVLLLKTGTYTGDFVCSWSGTKALPITIKPYAGGSVTIDGTFTFGNHVHVYDIDFTDTRSNRLWQYYGLNADEGITATGQGNHLHGCAIQQQRSSGVNWFGSEADNEGEVSENVILLNGIRYEDNSGHGHSLYSHNNLGGRRVIARNSMHLNLGDYTLQLYSASNKTDDYSVIDNVFMGNVYPGGHFGPNNLIYQNNVSYLYSLQIAFGMGEHTCDNMLFDGNILLNQYQFSIGGAPGTLTNLVESNNTAYGGYLYGDYLSDPHTGYTFAALPATWSKLTAFTKSTRWKGMLSIYNRDSAATVAVDFSGVLAAGSYRLKNTQNLAETWAFEYTSGSVNVPTNFTSGAFIGDAYQPATTWPVFGAFVIETA